MNRIIISLAIATNTSPDAWVNQDWRTIVTAIEILNKQNEKEDPESRQMSG